MIVNIRLSDKQIRLQIIPIFQSLIRRPYPNSSGYERLCVNFNTDNAAQTVFVIEADGVDFDPALQQVSWNNVMVGTVSRSSVFQQPTYSELFNVDVSQGPEDNDQVLFNTSNITGWGHSG
jgi:hypothetical protein